MCSLLGHYCTRTVWTSFTTLNTYVGGREEDDDEKEGGGSRVKGVEGVGNGPTEEEVLDRT